MSEAEVQRKLNLPKKTALETIVYNVSWLVLQMRHILIAVSLCVYIMSKNTCLFFS